jgi:hypothetical protein
MCPLQSSELRTGASGTKFILPEVRKGAKFGAASVYWQLSAVKALSAADPCVVGHV